MIKAIKVFLKSTSWGRVLYKPLNKVYRLYSVPKRRRILKKSGYKVLEKVFEISREEDLKAFPLFGTLLGFIREGGFIPWDDDIDLGIVANEPETPHRVAEILINKYGFEFVRGFAHQGRVVEYCLSYMDLTIDFFFLTPYENGLATISSFWKKEKGYSNHRQNSVYLMKHPTINGLEKYYVHDVEIDVPINYEDILIAEYGENWRVPIKTYTSNDQTGNKELTDFSYILDYKQFLNRDFGL